MLLKKNIDNSLENQLELSEAFEDSTTTKEVHLGILRSRGQLSGQLPVADYCSDKGFLR